ncbi:putative cyclase-domain-containing protein [Emericellopsis atlantica]|uniref:Cyclase-domain-containing protein n=1 Tax=Emericellopsis atlantica TaxID=2614577 RepID=A0A9P8CY08_9HYPO|nr:putative cyclase-domain-containing protein [Emericellopsis atlantica]KAG9259156.1 putative cyclase-domain-containing protein [Emericellopsis atlantica]
MSPPRFPSFDELPLDTSGPPGNAWGLWGPDDELGRLNLLTPDVVAAAASEIQEGVRISLDWPLNKPSFPTFGRQPFHHEILNKAPMTMNDDAISINTQSSTQWDGFRHYGYQRAKQFYQGHTQDEFSNDSGPIGIDTFSNSGGIIGRGVLVDWYGWAQKHEISRSAFETGAIHLSEIKAIVEENSIQLRHGDILFIRTGFTAQYNALSPAEQANLPNRQPGGLLGFEATRDSMRWLWENRFAAVASDAMGFERGPATGPYNDPDLSVHQWALAGWGMPIGEMFDLETLAEKCAARGRWSFFLCSVPLKIPGGVASPGNAVAIL